MANVRQKAPGLLVNRRGGRGRGLTVVAREQRVAPRPPPGLSPYARRVWREFFGDWVADAVVWSADGERLRWWIQCVAERQRLAEILRKAPLVRGATGALIPNPVARLVRELTRDIERTEEAFGMTPTSRFRLQLLSTESQRSANDLRRELMREIPAGEVIDLEEL